MPRKLIRAVALLAVAVSSVAFAAGDTAKPITIIVPFTHGGPTDDIAQVLAPALSKALGRPVREKNVIGAGGTLGAEQVSRAGRDGSTLLLANMGHATSRALYRGLRYDPVKSFEPIGLVADVPMMLVARSTLAAANLSELRAQLGAGPGKLTYGHAGIGSASHLCGLMLSSALGVEFAPVAYPGTADAMADLVAGRFDLMCDQSSNTIEPIQAGKVKVFGVTSKARVPDFQHVPTLAEGGLPRFDLLVWHGLYAPKGTPVPVIDKLAAALQAALKDPDLKARLAGLGALPVPPERARPQALRRKLDAEIAKWAPIIRNAGLHVE